MKIIARHKWVEGCIITESVDETKDEEGKTSYRRFTATIRGFRNWKIFEGRLTYNTAKRVHDAVLEIRNKIDSGKDDGSLFNFTGYFLS